MLSRGVTLDAKLSNKSHLKCVSNKVTRLFWACRGIFQKKRRD